MIYSSNPGLVERDGKWVNERDLMSKGEPPPVETTEPTPLVWQFLEGDAEHFIEVMFDKRGRKHYRACARLDDPAYNGEAFKCSREYRACDAADAQPFNAYSVTNPLAEAHTRELAAAIARHDMRKDEAALSDMRRIAKELWNDLMYPYKAWQREQEHIRAKKLEQAAARVQLRLALEALADEPDLLELLKELVKSDG